MVVDSVRSGRLSVNSSVVTEALPTSDSISAEPAPAATTAETVATPTDGSQAPTGSTTRVTLPESTLHPKVQAQGRDAVTAVVGEYEGAWPWVSTAYARSNILFFDRRLPEPCEGFPACVVGIDLLLTLDAVQSEDSILHELGHVWNNTSAGDWRQVQSAFSDHYAGCYSSKASADQLHEELLVDAMVIAAGAAEGSSNLSGYGYYESGPWNDGFGGCLVDSSEPPPELLTSIERELFNCSFDLVAAHEQANNANTSFLQSDEQRRLAHWEALIPRVCAHDPTVQADAITEIDAIIAKFEIAWPWVRDAWEVSSVEITEDLTDSCPPDASLTLRRNIFGGSDAFSDPPIAICVIGTDLSITLSGLDEGEEMFREPLLHALARVWNAMSPQVWQPVQTIFAEHYAGCHSTREPDPQRLQQHLLTDAMVFTAGDYANDSIFDAYGYFPGHGDQPFLGCSAAFNEPSENLMDAVEQTLFRCPYQQADAEAAWLDENDAFSVVFGSITRHWESVAEDVCASPG